MWISGSYRCRLKVKQCRLPSRTREGGEKEQKGRQEGENRASTKNCSQLVQPHFAKFPASRKPLGCKFDSGLDARAALASRTRCRHRGNTQLPIRNSSPRAHCLSRCLFSPTPDDPRHRTRPFSLSPPARPSGQCDALSLARPQFNQQALRQNGECPVRIVLSVSQKRVRRNSYMVSIPPISLGTARGNSCALRLRVFCFSVSSQDSSRTTSTSFCAPPEMQTLVLGADPSRFRVPQLQGQKETQQMYVYVKWNRFGLRFPRRRFGH